MPKRISKYLRIAQRLECKLIDLQDKADADMHTDGMLRVRYGREIDDLRKQVNRLLKTKDEVEGCFKAAYSEGLDVALAETTDERLKDLVERRLLYAYYAVQPS